jgi:16S rRNA (cytosine967-C5)-methyltransferase
MTPGARLQAAIELCADIDSSAVSADALTDVYFRSRRYAGSKDRRAVIERVYGLLRRRARLGWWIARAGVEVGARTRVIADLALSDTIPTDDIEALFGQGKYGPSPLSPAETALAASLSEQPLSHPDMPGWIVREYPEWLDGPLRGALGDSLNATLEAMNHPAPVDLRVNTLKASRKQARASLAKAGIESQPTPLSPLGLRLTGRPRLGGTEAFRQGLVEVQDEGSQLIALLTDARPGMTVIDFCAGAGGKTLALAAAMGAHGGTLTACDVSAKRLRRMDGRLRRAGVGPVRQHRLDENPSGPPDLEQADRVLVDAPCSGTGTWRRAPEARWRLSPSGLEDLMARQDNILDSACTVVKPGGRLVYATCSMLAGENVVRVERFLSRNAEFTLLPIADVWAETLTGPCPTTEPTLSLGPATTGTDGFFVAVLQRWG